MILVTGGTGLLGSHLLVELTSKGYAVRSFSRSKSKIQDVKKVFEYYYPTQSEELFQKIEWLEGDILDCSALEEAMENVTDVFHCAALVSFQKRDFYRLMKINREGTANVVNACLAKGINKICYVSSTAAIGGEENPITELSKWKQSPSTSGYAISKYSAEKEIWRGVEEGLKAVIVNPCLIVGAGNWDESSMTMFRTIEKGLSFYTSGSNAFVDARDVASIMVQLQFSTIENERFLCIGENCSFKDFFQKIAVQLNKKPASIEVPKKLVQLAALISFISSKFSGNNPTITKETARSAFSQTQYDASKIKKSLNVTFRTIDEMIANAIKGRI